MSELPDVLVFNDVGSTVSGLVYTDEEFHAISKLNSTCKALELYLNHETQGSYGVDFLTTESGLVASEGFANYFLENGINALVRFPKGRIVLQFAQGDTPKLLELAGMQPDTA